MSRASGGVQGKHSQSRKSIFKLGKEDMIHVISNVEGQSEDGEQGEPILVVLRISVKTCCSQAGAITASLLLAWASNTVLVFRNNILFRVNGFTCLRPFVMFVEKTTTWPLRTKLRSNTIVVKVNYLSPPTRKKGQKRTFWQLFVVDNLAVSLISEKGRNCLVVDNWNLRFLDDDSPHTLRFSRCR